MPPYGETVLLQEASLWLPWLNQISSQFNLSQNILTFVTLYIILFMFVFNVSSPPSQEVPGQWDPGQFQK